MKLSPGCPVLATGGSVPEGQFIHSRDGKFKEEQRSYWYSEVGLHQLGSRPTVDQPRWTAHPYIL